MKNVIKADFTKYARQNAQCLTDAQINAIRAQGLVVVCRPDNLRLQQAEKAMQRQQSCVSLKLVK